MAKFLVASDFHGSLIALQKTLDLFKEHQADKLIILGDTFGTDAEEMVELLNSVANRLTIVKGNNDWYFESENAKFTLFNETYENIIVTKEIVDYMVEYLTSIYTDGTFKLREYAREYKEYSKNPGILLLSIMVTILLNSYCYIL